jgi:hypothetical protein
MQVDHQDRRDDQGRSAGREADCGERERHENERGERRVAYGDAVT